MEYVKIAGEKSGYKIDIVFFPDGTYNEQNLINSMQIKPVAQITIAQDELKKESLYDFMFFPDTNRVVHTPVYAMIMSSSNNRTAQVKAGMVYSRLVLTAHSWGFVLQPTSQALEECPEMKGIYDNIYRDYADNGSNIQMLVRIGMPTSRAERSMRRNVRELLIY